jgi:DNA polymerase I-like protein with 3'-5' exonuclease and polymerase domains
MGWHEDDVGLLWIVPPKVTAKRESVIRSVSLPPTDWLPPDEFPSLRDLKRISIDVETKDLNLRALGPGTLRDAYIVGLAIGTDDGRRWYFPTRHEGGGNLDEDAVWRWARAELNAFAGIVVGAHLIYDLDHLWNYGVTFPNVKGFHDVQIAEPLLDEHRLRYNLESLAQDYLGEGKQEEFLLQAAQAYGIEPTQEAIKSNIYRFPACYAGIYGESDVDLPLRILDLQMVKLKEQGLLELFSLESRLLPVLLAMRRRGVRVNVAGAEEVRVRLVQERDNLLARMRRLAGPNAEFMAPDSFAKALVERGLRVGRTPKSGQYSVTGAWLKENEGDELVDAIQAGRKVNTIINTFIDGHILGHAIKGRIHCEFVQLKDGEGGTGARFSSRRPNLQNIPARDEELAPLVRGLFEPDEGEDWERQDQCLTADTIVITIDGPKTIKELVENPVPVLSSPDCIHLGFQPVIAARSSGIRPVYLVTLEDGSSVRCTDNHRWMGYENEEIYTRDLLPGTRLAHVRESMAGRGDTGYWFIRWGTGTQVYKHQLVAKYEFGPCPEGYEVDHKDRNHTNWWRDNLQYLPITVNRGQAAGFWWNDATEEQRSKRTSQLVGGIKDNRRSYQGEGNPNHGKKRPGVGGRPKPGEPQAPCTLCGRMFYFQRSINAPFCSKICVRRSQNHKVLSVVPCGEEEVFDITVANTHTFVLANGLISHNSQMEYRLMVHYARGEGAKEARAQYTDDPKTDFHKLCATMLGADPDDPIIRKRVKNTNFAKSYGAMAPRLAVTFGCSIEEAEKFIQLYESKLPFTKTTFDEAQKSAAKRGYVKSVLGRYARFPLWEPVNNFRQKKNDRKPGLPRERAEKEYGPYLVRAWTYKALNNVLQFSNADSVKKSMVDIWEAGLCAPDALGPYLLQVHDELDYSVPRTVRGDEAAREAKHLMETAIKLRVPVIVEASRGSNWGECV